MAQKAFVPLVEHSTSQKTLFPLVEFSRFGWHNEWQQSGNEKNQKTVTLYFISLKYCMLTRSSKYTISTFIIFYNHPYHHAIWQQCYSMQVRPKRAPHFTLNSSQTLLPFAANVPCKCQDSVCIYVHDPRVSSMARKTKDSRVESQRLRKCAWCKRWQARLSETGTLQIHWVVPFHTYAPSPSERSTSGCAFQVGMAHGQSHSP